MLASLYNGNVHVWNIESQQLVKSFEVSALSCDDNVFSLVNMKVFSFRRLENTFLAIL